MNDSLFKLNKFHNLLKFWKDHNHILYSVFLPSQEVIENIIICRDDKYAIEYYNFIVKNSNSVRTKENSKLIDQIYEIYLDLMSLQKPENKKELIETEAIASIQEKKEIHDNNDSSVKNIISSSNNTTN